MIPTQLLYPIGARCIDLESPAGPGVQAQVCGYFMPEMSRLQKLLNVPAYNSLTLATVPGGAVYHVDLEEAGDRLVLLEGFAVKPIGYDGAWIPLVFILEKLGHG